MGLFTKKSDDGTWHAAALAASDEVEALSEVLNHAGIEVARDRVDGWRFAGPLFEDLKGWEQRLKGLESEFKRIGSPRSSAELKRAKHIAGRFFMHADLAFLSGGFHLSDASGGPGHRARTETGFAQRAALKRVENNGTRFANHALQASEAGAAFLQAVGRAGRGAQATPPRLH